MKRANDFWNTRAKSYDAQVARYTQTYANTVTRTVKYLQGGERVLDFACGTGITTLEVARHAKWVTAVDPAEQMLAVAREKAEKVGVRNVEFVATSIFDERFAAGSFDVVTAFNVLYLLPGADATVRRFCTLLKPGGLFFSATDCLGESNAFVIRLELLLSRLKIFPYAKAFRRTEIEALVRAGGFSVLETASLYDAPPNYYIAARKASLGE
jgi:2-polyprenyl-3-methyl-5-hydroxy-6-metoxy-1,4-benzoquinol methylase